MKTMSLAIVDGIGTKTKEYFKIIEKVLKENTFLNITDICYLTTDMECNHKDYNIHTIPPLNYLQFNEFLFNKLGDYCLNDTIMHIQTDGFPINPHLWKPEFLNYDYIGAPWPSNCLWCQGEPKVGNGGFCIRSKKLYEQTKRIANFTDFAKAGINEDVFITQALKDFLQQNNITIAPLEIAKQFSMENPIDDTHTLKTVYGFHGKWLLSEIN